MALTPLRLRHDAVEGFLVTDPAPPTPYLHFPGTALEALTFYGDVFGCSVQRIRSRSSTGSTGHPGPSPTATWPKARSSCSGADVAGQLASNEDRRADAGLVGPGRALDAPEWFTKLSMGGRVVDDLQRRPWGAFDGQVVDRYGLHWLIGFESDGTG